MPALARTRQEIDLAWHTFLEEGRAPSSVRAEIVRSWVRTRGEWNVDPALRTCTRALAADDLAEHRERDEWFDEAAPIVTDLADRVAQDGHVVGWFDSGGWMLALEGSPSTRERLGQINFLPGACWSEALTGTNGVGTALLEGRPVEVFASEHFVAAWQEWSCASVPVRAEGRLVGVIDITSPWRARHPGLLLCAEAMARAVEARLELAATRRREAVRAALVGRPGGWLAVDLAGASLATGPAAAIDGCDPATLRASDLAPLLVPLRAAAMRSHPAARADQDGTVELGGRRVRVVCSPVEHGGRTVGAVLSLVTPPRARPAPRPGRRPLYDFADVLGGSPALGRQVAAARRAAGNGLPVLILGESGTGKELFAQAIHSASSRAHGPFIALNCGCIPQSLVEAELFGYEPGSFTGGRKEGSRGRFEDADGGTLFLDEVSELSPLGQTALLRVLQEREVTRVGSSAARPVDVRIVAASNKDLLEEIRAGRFRRDLYYRLNVLSVELPPLRCRREDVPRLAEHHLARALAELRRDGLTFAPEVLDALVAHDWPGNVRELKNVVERAAVAAAGARIDLCDLPPELLAGAAGPASALVVPAPLQAIAEGPGAVESERVALRRALEDSAWNVVRAARALGVSRRTMYRKLQRLGVTRADGRAREPAALT